MDYLPLSDNAARQAIDSSTLFGEHQRVAAQARAYRGGVYWKEEGAYTYLVKTQPDNGQTRLGPRSPETEKIYAEFTQKKQTIEDRLRALKAALTDAERLKQGAARGSHASDGRRGPARFI